MAREWFSYWLTDVLFLVVEFMTVRGWVTEFVVRLMAQTERGPVNIARYDTAHGLAHRDVLDRRGRIKSKDWLFDLDLDRALDYAISDFKENHERYYHDWQD